jgi:hypothetical protein
MQRYKQIEKKFLNLRSLNASLWRAAELVDEFQNILQYITVSVLSLINHAISSLAPYLHSDFHSPFVSNHKLLALIFNVWQRILLSLQLVRAEVPCIS